MKPSENQNADGPTTADLERLKNLALSENGFLFDPVSGFAYNLNPTAVSLFQQLQRGKNREEILDYMRTHYDAHADDFETDLDQFLRRLQEYGLLVWKKREKADLA